jgi:hypothetical protein
MTYLCGDASAFKVCCYHAVKPILRVCVSRGFLVQRFNPGTERASRSTNSALGLLIISGQRFDIAIGHRGRAGVLEISHTVKHIKRIGSAPFLLCRIRQTLMHAEKCEFGQDWSAAPVTRQTSCLFQYVAHIPELWIVSVFWRYASSVPIDKSLFCLRIRDPAQGCQRHEHLEVGGARALTFNTRLLHAVRFRVYERHRCEV